MCTRFLAIAAESVGNWMNRCYYYLRLDNSMKLQHQRSSVNMRLLRIFSCVAFVCSASLSRSFGWASYTLLHHFGIDLVKFNDYVPGNLHVKCIASFPKCCSIMEIQMPMVLPASPSWSNLNIRLKLQEVNLNTGCKIGEPFECQQHWHPCRLVIDYLARF